MSGCIGSELSKCARVCVPAYVWSRYTYLWIYCVRAPSGMFRPLELFRRRGSRTTRPIRSVNSFRILMEYRYIDFSQSLPPTVVCRPRVIAISPRNYILDEVLTNNNTFLFPASLTSVCRCSRRILCLQGFFFAGKSRTINSTLTLFTL